MKKNDQTKELLLEQLKKTPIIQIACEKMGIARATLYRWKDEDPAFAEMIDKAVREGCLMVNDLAESQLIGAVKDRNIQAIMYWLRHHHTDYTNRLEVMAKVQTQQEELTDEQAAVVKSALRLASLLPQEPTKPTNQFIEAVNPYDETKQSGVAPKTPVQPPSAGTCGANDQGS